jgi:ankyrin repeat protein
MQRRKFLHNALLLGTTGAVPGVALAASQLDPPPITGLMLPPLDDAGTSDLLGWAVNREYFEVVKSLIGQGINVNAKGEWNRTPLHIAAESKSVAVVQYLISQRADLHAKDNFGATPLHNAASGRNSEVVKYLVSQGADVHAKDKSGRTPLHRAVERPSLESVKYLVSQGADINVRDNGGNTSLHCSTWYCFRYGIELPEYLITHGAAINAKNANGSTPLHVAAKRGSVEAVQYLISQGADVHATDNEGKTALDRIMEKEAAPVARTDINPRRLIGRSREDIEQAKQEAADLLRKTMEATA